ncbi:carboxypeptidase regulatory-like domain-containing protein [Pedobacter sp. MC2016-05]|uniref:TonB-dependent receptor n=1 Tax=Pedobacter sp. MC2016-05 TaxID=2994474 RepID=UPI002247320B|nr:carboxypeptidase regulatory-like domain-containing protein [Pedobacter sp. MC2016-05]MCX2474902.1 carboxypeptidase regulatory-like domain-containing protein [Pedobacter sp. MC2016-05]
MNKSLLLRLVLVIVAVVGITFGASAQVTTSSMTGTIKDAKGALPGASVKATHTPTGTVYSVSTNNDGRFTIGGMRVGGPYTVEISFVGYRPEKVNDIYLKIGEPFVINPTLVDNSATLAEVKVVGQSSNSVLNSNRNGTSTVINKAQIQSLPTITRSVNDLTRLTPQANGTSIGGGNYRSNNFTVDGANFNNQFGIGGNIPAGGSPISIDALEQISINVTPYDARQTGFTGGSVSAVTRSGTNTFSGNAFYTMRGDDQQGKRIGDTYRIPERSIQKLDEKNYGFSLGGPIVKDKLFFFVNYEKKNTTSPGTQRIASSEANPYIVANPNVVQASESFLNDVSSYLFNTYGYSTGPYQGYSNQSDNEKMFARLDWNINKNHRFSVRYNQVESKTPASASTSTGGSPIGTVTGYAYVNQRSGTNRNAGLPFFNSNYYQAANLYSGVAELNSNFGSKVTNVLRATYSHQNDPRTTDGNAFPLVDILDGNPTSSANLGSVLTTFGYEPFSYGNLRDVKGYTYSDDLSIALGKHNITLGLQAEFSTTKNGFQRFGTGFYTFRSWNDFITNQRPAQYTVTYPLTADGSQAYPSFKFAQYSAYLQDEFTITDRLKVTAGVRVEQASYPDVTEVRTHPLVAGLSFGGQRVDTGVLPENKLSFSPRFGFNWDVLGDRSFQVRGGSGIFTGRIPFVWIVSQSGDAGLIQYTQSYVGNAAPYFNPSIAPQLSTAAPAAGSSIPSAGISVMAPDLKFPQTWKSSLAFDFRLPGGVVATLEGIYGRDLNVAFAKNLNLVNPGIQVSGYGDTRLFYPASNSDKYYNPINAAGLPVAQGTPTGGVNGTVTGFNAIQMSNVKGGYNWMATAQLTKQFSNGLTAMIAYTRSDQRNFGDQSGDQLANLWSLPQTSVNPNTPTLSYSSNLNPDRIVANISYRKAYFGNLATSFSLFYEGSQQGRFSYTYNGDFNRDGVSGNDLIYIPNVGEYTAASFVAVPANTTGYARAYSAQEQADLFEAYIAQDKYLSKNRGKFAERNGGTSPWRNQFDFRLTQEVFKDFGKTKNSFQFTVDIFNVGNLLNRKWGNQNFVNNAAILVPQNVSAINALTKPTFRVANASNDVVRETFGTTQTILSTYYMQFGVRYNFN